MEYSYAQYQADRKLLRFRDGVALPVPATLPLKLEKAMQKADAAEHAAMEAAANRLLDLAQAVAERGEGVIPMPPPRSPRPRSAAKPAEATPPKAEAAQLPVAGAATPAAPERAGTMTEEEWQEEAKAAHRAAMAVWNKALEVQAGRHARRREAWPDLKPPFKDSPPQAR